jgi:N-formylmaleamate deformylase
LLYGCPLFGNYTKIFFLFSVIILSGLHQIAVNHKKQAFLNYTVMKKVFALLIISLIIFQSNAQNNAFKVEVSGKGQPIILIPGYSCSGEVWNETVAHLKNKYECHVITIAGYAGVPKLDTPILKTVRNELINYVKTKKLNKPMLIGHSLGAFMSLWVSSVEPDLFGKIICVDGLPFVSAVADTTANAEVLKKNPQFNPEAVAKNFEMIPSENYVANMTRAMLAQVNDTVRAKQIANWSYQCDRKTLGYTIVEISTTDLREEIAKIKQPVLVLGSIYGTETNSHLMLNHQFKKVANKTIEVANSKHFIMYDVPEWFYAKVDAFLQ